MSYRDMAMDAGATDEDEIWQFTQMMEQADWLYYQEEAMVDRQIDMLLEQRYLELTNTTITILPVTISSSTLR